MRSKGRADMRVLFYSRSWRQADILEFSGPGGWELSSTGGWELSRTWGWELSKTGEWELSGRGGRKLGWG